MKKLAIVFGILLAAGFSLVVGGLVLANRVTNEAHRSFFEMVHQGDADALLAESLPALRDEIDGPVLQAWMAQINKTLGQFQGTSGNGFKYNVRHDGDNRITVASGVAKFTSGTAQTELTYVNGRLAGFNVSPRNMPSGWFRGPSDTTIYHQRAETFLRHFFAADAEKTSDLMHPSLRKAVPTESLQTMMATAGSWIGSLSEVEILDDSFTNEDREILTVNVRLHGESAITTALVKFEFAGLKGHLIEFDVTRPVQSTSDITE